MVFCLGKSAIGTIEKLEARNLFGILIYSNLFLNSARASSLFCIWLTYFTSIFDANNKINILLSFYLQLAKKKKKWQQVKELQLSLQKPVVFVCIAVIKMCNILNLYSGWECISQMWVVVSDHQVHAGCLVAPLQWGLSLVCMGFYGKTSDLTKPKQWLCQIVAVLCLSAPTLNKEPGNSEQRKARGQRGDVKTAHLTN